MHAGIYHGSEGLSSILTTKELHGPSPVWNEYLEFDLNVADIPRMARLCLVLYGVEYTKKRRPREVSCEIFSEFVNVIANITPH